MPGKMPFGPEHFHNLNFQSRCRLHDVGKLRLIEAARMMRPRHDGVQHRTACVRVDFNKPYPLFMGMKIVAKEDSLRASRIVPCDRRGVFEHTLSLGRHGDDFFNGRNHLGHPPGLRLRDKNRTRREQIRASLFQQLD